MLFKYIIDQEGGTTYLGQFELSSHRHFSGSFNYYDRQYFVISRNNGDIEIHLLDGDALKLYGRITIGRPASSLLRVFPSNGNSGIFYDHTPGLLYEYTDKEVKPIDLSGLEEEIIEATYEGGYIWILTNAGAFRLIENQNKLSSGILKSAALNTVLKDREGNFWFGSKGQGVFVIPSLQANCYNSENSGFKDDNVLVIRRSEGKNLLVGHNGAELSIIDGQSRVKTYSLGYGDYINDILSMKDGSLLLGMNRGLYHITPTNKINRLSKKSIKALYQTSDGEIWVTDSRLISVKSPDSLYAKKNAQNELLQKRVYAICEAFDGSVWLGSSEGVFIYENGAISVLKLDGLPLNVRVSGIAQTRDSTLWISTLGRGVLKISGRENIQIIDEQSGLLSNVCLSIYGHQNDVWIGTDAGLIGLKNGQAKESVILNRYDGLPSEEIQSVLIDSQYIWAGTPRGLVQIPHRAVEINKVPPQLHWAGLEVNGKSRAMNASYTLAHDENTLGIFYQGVSHRNRGDITYLYRMKGLTDSWTATRSQISRFFSLPPGRYRFEVKALNEDSIALEQPLAIDFHIQKAWWQTWWFRVMALLGFSASVGGFIFWRTNERRKREREADAFKARIQRLRMEALQSQMNPHFIFNALNAIQDFLLTKDSENATYYLSSFASMIRMIFDQSRKKEITLREELEFLGLYLEMEELRFGDLVQIHLEVEESLKQQENAIYIPPLMIQPIIENAFKHGLMHRQENGRLTIEFGLIDGFLEAVITDNGIGRKRAAEINKWRQKGHRSSGLEATRERLEAFHKIHQVEVENALQIIDLHNENGQSAGTRARLKIYTGI